MSYCTIEEAWGNTQEFSQTSQKKNKKHKKKCKKNRTPPEEHFDNFQNYDGVYEDNEESLVETIPNNSNEHQRSFSRTLAPLQNHGQDEPRVPEEIHFVDNLSPGNEYQSVGSPFQGTPEVENIVQENVEETNNNTEMDWLKNNMSYMFERMETLTKKLDSVGLNGNSSSTESSSPTDVILFVILGALTIFAVDVFFRAGQRSISR